MPFIYKTVDLLNGKVYIGQTRTNNTSYLVSGVWITNAIKKYGKENFQRVVLEECSLEQLNEREQYWIALYNSTNADVGYNLTSGGKQSTKFSESSRQKMSTSKKGTRLGYKHSDDTKRKMCESRKNVSDATKEKIRLSRIGKTHSDETKLKISEAPTSDVTKEKIRLSKLGSSHSEDTKKKMSESHKGRTAWNKGLITGPRKEKETI